MPAKQNPRRGGDVQTEDLPDGSTLLFHPSNLMTYPISSSASLVWRACDGRHSMDEIVDQIETEYEVDRETVKKDVNRLLDDFAQFGLLQDWQKPASADT